MSNAPAGTDRPKPDPVLPRSLPYQALIIQSLPVALFSACPPGMTEWASENAERLTGFPATRFVREPDFLVLRMHPEDRERVLAAGSDPVSFRWRVADESYRWFESQGFLLHDPSGGPDRLVGILVDVTAWASATEQHERGQRIAETHERDLAHIWEARTAELALRRSFEAEREARRRTELLQTACLALTRHLDLDTVLATLVEHLARLVPCDGTCLMTIGTDGRVTVREFASLRGATVVVHQATLNSESLSLLRWMRARAQRVLVPDTSVDPRWGGAASTAHVRSWVGLPIVVAGRLFGVCILNSLTPGRFIADDVALAEALTGQAAVAIENALLYQDVHRSRQQLRQMSVRLIQVQEEERRQLARELHDEIGQTLTVLRLLADGPGTTEGTARAASRQEACRLVDRLLSQVRTLSLDLRPSMLDDLGLLPALLWQVDRFAAQTNIDIRFVHAGLERRFPAEVETAVFRIIQEGLTNVVRHSGAARATLHVQADADEIVVSLEDAGRGFDVRDAGGCRPPSSGLLNIRERAGLLGGEVTVDSLPGKGTRIVAVIPCPP